MSRFIQSVGVRSLLSRVHHGQIETHKDVDDEIDDIIKELEEIRPDLKKTISDRDECRHDEFNQATYTIQRRLIGSVRVNSRVCRKCGHEDTHQEGSHNPEGVRRPAWASDASKQYYNNDI